MQHVKPSDTVLTNRVLPNQKEKDDHPKWAKNMNEHFLKGGHLSSQQLSWNPGALAGEQEPRNGMVITCGGSRAPGWGVDAALLPSCEWDVLEVQLC